jgi:hypothetical protein
MATKRKPHPLFKLIPCSRCNGTGQRQLGQSTQAILALVIEKRSLTSTQLYEFRMSRRHPKTTKNNCSAELRNMWNAGLLRRHHEQNAGAGEYVYTVNTDVLMDSPADEVEQNDHND